MSIVQWKDNTVDYIGSSFSNIEPTKLVKRYSQKEKKKIEFVQSVCFHQYNQGMGGVNLLDRFIANTYQQFQQKSGIGRYLLTALN